MGTISALVTGRQATAAPPLGPALGPLGVNIGAVIAKINKETAEFKGMTVPVKVIVNDKTKTFEIEVGTPPATALIKAKAKIEKGSGNHKEVKAGNITMDDILSVVNMKKRDLGGITLKAKVMTVIGTCGSLG